MEWNMPGTSARGDASIRARFFGRSGLALLASLLVLSILATGAVAAQPVSSTFTETYTDEVVFECDGFDVLNSGVVRGRDTVYFDREGHAIRHVLQLRVSGTFTNSATGEIISPDHASFTIDEGLINPDAVREGPRPGTFRVIGLELKIKVDGRVALVETGQLFVDIHDYHDPNDDEVVLFAGRHDRDSFDICAALG